MYIEGAMGLHLQVAYWTALAVHAFDRPTATLDALLYPLMLTQALRWLYPDASAWHAHAGALCVLACIGRHLLLRARGEFGRRDGTEAMCVAACAGILAHSVLGQILERTVDDVDADWLLVDLGFGSLLWGLFALVRVAMATPLQWWADKMMISVWSCTQLTQFLLRAYVLEEEDDDEQQHDTLGWRAAQVITSGAQVLLVSVLVMCGPDRVLASERALRPSKPPANSSSSTRRSTAPGGAIRATPTAMQAGGGGSGGSSNERYTGAGTSLTHMFVLLPEAASAERAVSSAAAAAAMAATDDVDACDTQTTYQSTTLTFEHLRAPSAVDDEEVPLSVTEDDNV